MTRRSKGGHTLPERPPLTLAAGLDEVRARLGQLPSGRTRWVGIDGFGAAGKTTFAHTVSTMINNAVVVHVDDFSGPGIPTWDHDRFRTELLEPLLAGRSARYRVSDPDIDVLGSSVAVDPGQVLIIEGVSSTDEAVAVPWDLTVWLETPAEVRWQRVLARDPVERLEIWRTEWIPSERAYAERQRPRERADLVIRGDQT
ncbi:uridine kinase family protein [Propionibacteriaceae bacterium Y1685]|uniref:uridine kinase family protein n=1 Tax=Microlunatus sp. Y1700 TaxID=3418487 RepID=UPI003B8292F8